MNLGYEVIDRATLHKLNEILDLLKEIYKIQNANKYIEELEKENKRLNEKINEMIKAKFDPIISGIEVGSDVK